MHDTLLGQLDIAWRSRATMSIAGLHVRWRDSIAATSDEQLAGTRSRWSIADRPASYAVRGA